MSKEEQPIKFPNQKLPDQIEEVSPWLIKVGRIAIARKIKGQPSVMWANGFVKLSDRVFWAHNIKKGDVVQIRAGWNNNATGIFAQVEEVILESAKLSVPVPEGGGSKILKMKNVPVGALIRIGKAQAKLSANVLRNPLRAQRKAKAQSKKSK